MTLFRQRAGFGSARKSPTETGRDAPTAHLAKSYRAVRCLADPGIPAGGRLSLRRFLEELVGGSNTSAVAGPDVHLLKLFTGIFPDMMRSAHLFNSTEGENAASPRSAPGELFCGPRPVVLVRFSQYPR